MVYDHMVKVNGQYYEAGQDIPEIDTAGSDNSLPFSDDDITLETKENKKYTKSDIQRMKTEDLKILASEVGINNAFETNGSKLKEMLIEYYGL